jgi:formiminotetrahydrofolate cyclodeaminase
VLDRTLAAFLDDVAAKTSAPGGGAVAAVVVGLAAALAAMTARFSERKLGEEATAIAAQADELRAEAGDLAQADAEAYGAYLEAIRRPEDDPGRDTAVRDATDRSAAVPLRIAEIGALVSGLAPDLGERGNPNLAGDAYTSGVLAQAGTRAAANLVVVNLADEADERVQRARELAGAASERAERAVAADPGPEPKP